MSKIKCGFQYHEKAEWLDGQSGWSGSAYKSECEVNLVSWMAENMTGPYECDLKFNGGDPLYIFFIQETRDAEFFTLVLR